MGGTMHEINVAPIKCFKLCQNDLVLLQCKSHSKNSLPKKTVISCQLTQENVTVAKEKKIVKIKLHMRK